MVRTRVVQSLFAHYQNPGKTMLSTRKELLKSFADTYDLYFALLDFTNVLTAYAQQQMDEQAARARAMHTFWNPNKRFVQNRFAQQLFDNRALRRRVEEQHLSWESDMTAVADIYKELTEKEFYKDYMMAMHNGYEDDRNLWRRIYQHLLPDNASLHDALSEMEVVLDKTNWDTDAEIVLSYVVKTVKRFNEQSTPDTELLPMFDDESEVQFATDLLQKTLDNRDKCEELINSHLKGWEADRIAYMDRIILYAALTEIIEFPEIALTVSMNEYIELAKEYSGDKSYMFINGILTEILRDLQHDDQLIKAAALK